MGDPRRAGNAIAVLKALLKWVFAAAFLCVGLELSVRKLGAMGWRPVVVYLSATVFTTVLAFGVAWLIFGLLGM